MAFRLSFSQTYEWPIEYSYIAETGGKIETVSFTAKFNRDRTILDKITEKDEDGKQKYTDVEVCKMIVKSWKDIQDENGNDLPYSEEALDSMLKQAIGLTQTFVSRWSVSIQKAQEKNLKK